MHIAHSRSILDVDQYPGSLFMSCIDMKVCKLFDLKNLRYDAWLGSPCTTVARESHQRNNQKSEDRKNLWRLFTVDSNAIMGYKCVQQSYNVSLKDLRMND